ncbi:hypothetical protein DMENIID0001_074520 [Sergentomyia squamirostris]
MAYSWIFAVLIFTINLPIQSSFVLLLEDKVAEVTTKALLAFFYDQRIISYILTQDELDSIVQQTFKTALYDTYHFTFYDFIASDLTKDSMLPGTEKGMTPHSNIHSYIMSSEIMFGEMDMVHNLFRQNPNAKWAVAITGFMTEDDILQFYRRYWKTYSMAFIFTFWNQYTFEISDNNITDIITAKAYISYIYLFNPFRFSDDGERGRLTKMDILGMKTRDDWAKVFYFYHNLMNNLYHYTLKVVLGEDDLLVARVSDIKYKYPDGELFTTLMRMMNFRIQRYPLGWDHLGGVLDNGTITGITYDLENNLLDIVGNSRLMTDLGTNNTIFMYPYLLSNSLFLVKKKNPRNKSLNVMVWEDYKYPLNYFHALVFVLSVLFFTIMELFYQWKICNRRMQLKQLIVMFIDSATLIFSYLEDTSSQSLKKWTKIYQRLFLVSLILYCMLLTNIFKGNIVKELSNSLISQDAKHVSEVLDSNKSVIYFNSIETIYRKFANDQNLMINKLRPRKVNCENWGDCLWSVIKEDIVMLVRDSYAYNARAEFWDNTTGSDLYHIIPEIPFSFFASLTVPKGSPYQRKLNSMIQLCTEMGIVQRGQASADHTLKLKRLRRFIMGQYIPEEIKKPINLNNIDMVLLTYIIMIAISTLVFLMELLFGKLLQHHFEPVFEYVN